MFGYTFGYTCVLHSKFAPFSSAMFMELCSSTDFVSFLGRRNLLTFYLIRFCGFRVSHLLYFKLSNWLELVNSGSTCIKYSVRNKTLIVKFEISDRDRLFFMSLSWAFEFFSQFPDVCLLRSERGVPLHGKYAVRYLNSILKIFGSKYGVLFSTESLRKCDEN